MWLVSFRAKGYATITHTVAHCYRQTNRNDFISQAFLFIFLTSSHTFGVAISVISFTNKFIMTMSCLTLFLRE